MEQDRYFHLRDSSLSKRLKEIEAEINKRRRYDYLYRLSILFVLGVLLAILFK